MSKENMSIRARRRKEAREKKEQARKEFQDVKQKLRGNPEIIEAIESLEAELDAIEDFLNI